MDDRVILDRRTMLLFFLLMHSQHLGSPHIPSGQQTIGQHKQQAGDDYPKYIISKLEGSYRCLPPSTIISHRDYDVIAISESKRKILLIESKFKDPPSSSFSRHTLVRHELTADKDSLLTQVIRHQERYELLLQKQSLFRAKLGLDQNVKDYVVKAYLVTKFTPLISSFGNVLVVSEKELMAQALP